MFKLPEPLSPSENPFCRISWMLFIAYVAARELSCIRRDHVRELGRLMRTEQVGTQCLLHHEDDVPIRRDVDRDLGKRLRDWHAAMKDARRLANARGIPFVVVEDVLASALSKLDAFWAIVWGDVSKETTVYPDYSLTDKLQNLADATSSPEASATELFDGSTKQRESDRRRMPAAEVNAGVRNWLERHAPADPFAVTAAKIARAVGCSKGAVVQSPSWRIFEQRRKALRQSVGREVPLTDGLLAVLPDAWAGREAELAALIEEQEADRRRDERRPTRRQRS